MFSGAVLAQLAAFLLAPVLSRLYTPEHFGILGIFVSVGGTVGAVASLRYEQAIMLADSEADAWTLQKLSLQLAALIAAFCGVGIAITFSIYPEFFEGLSFWLWILGSVALVFGLGAQSSLQVYASRKKLFQRISVSMLTRTLTTTTVQCLLFFWQTTGLVLGSILGLFASILPFGALLRFTPSPDDNPSSTLSLLKEYSDFPKYNAMSAVFNSLAQNAPVLVLAGFAGPASAGAYTMTVRLLQRPMSVITGPLRQVFYQHATATYREAPENASRLFRKTTLALGATTLIPAIIIISFGPLIFKWVLGQEWTEAGQQSQWLILWLSVAFANVPAVVMTRILRLEKAMLGYTIFLMVFRLAAIIAGVWLGGVLTGIAFYSIVGMVFNLLLILWVDRKITTSVLSRIDSAGQELTI